VAVLRQDFAAVLGRGHFGGMPPLRLANRFAMTGFGHANLLLAARFGGAHLLLVAQAGLRHLLFMQAGLRDAAAVHLHVATPAAVVRVARLGSHGATGAQAGKKKGENPVHWESLK
jgi:hypothetical protein